MAGYYREEQLMSRIPQVVCIGGATQDVFLAGKALAGKRDVRTKATVEQFPLGDKIAIDEVHYATGGDASNAAVTFARQGLKTSFVGKIGRDIAGAEVLREFRHEGVSADMVVVDTKKGTTYSTILVAPSGERVILSYAGAAHDLKPKEIDWPGLKADWFYVASIHGNFELLEKILTYAKHNDIKVAYVPSKADLAKPKKILKLLPGVHALIGNAQEIQSLFGIDTIRELMLTTIGASHYIVVTDGPNGVYVSDSDKIYKAPSYKKVKVVDRTGAGDAFGSGFIAALAQGKNVADAVTLGSANATSVVQHYGGKAGILKAQKLKPMTLTTMSA
jgi:sugar/nucleoside kinase (ribokinase family)